MLFNSAPCRAVSSSFVLGLTSILNLFGATLEPVIDKTTGKHAYSDYWGSSPIREINTRDSVNLIGTTLALGQGGTNVEIKLVVALINEGTNDFPRRMNGSISAQVRSSTNELNNKNLLGQLDGSIIFNPDKAAQRPIKVVKRAAELLEPTSTLFVYELSFEIPLRKKVELIPEYFCILASFTGELNFWRYTRMLPPEERPSTQPLVTEARATPSQASPQSAKRPQNTSSMANHKIATKETRRPVSDVRVSITREREFLLITCSPVAEGALLEEADLDSSPLKWRPLQDGSNQLSRWYVPLDDGARAFRIRLPK